MVFQNAALFDSLTVEENLALTYWENTGLPVEEIRTSIRNLLAMVGMDGVDMAISFWRNYDICLEDADGAGDGEGVYLVGVGADEDFMEGDHLRVVLAGGPGV